MRNEGVIIDIWIRGQAHGMRRWSVVPRVGEYVFVERVTYDDAYRDVMVKVDKIEWSTSLIDGDGSARLYCTPPEFAE